MIARPRQVQFVDRCHSALKQHGNTMAIAATGFGKTVALSFVGTRYKGKQLILQHREELLDQNSATYNIVNPKRKIGFIDGRRKDGRCNTTFGMFQTLAANKDLIPSNLDLIIADECHHLMAPTWREVVDIALEKSPKAHLLGVTATPRMGLGSIFSSVADHVTLREQMAVGLLKQLRTFICSSQKTQFELNKIKSFSSTGDQNEVASVLNNDDINEQVVRDWQERASDRLTICFCANVDHAYSVADSFSNAGINARAIHGGLPRGERRAILEEFHKGNIRVLTNVFLLTEGYDCPEVSCGILLRQSSEVGPLAQMAGRILRKFDGISDALWFDYGSSTANCGTLEQSAELLPEVAGEPGVGQQKFCPEQYGDTYSYRFPDVNGKTGCGAEIPANTRTCPMCGYIFDRVGHSSDPVPVELTEVDILNASPFRYVDLFGDGMSLMACGFEAFAIVVSLGNDVWHAVGGRNKKVDRLHYGSKLQTLAAADDFLRCYETEKAAKKSSCWQTECATRKQAETLNKFGYRLTMGIMGCNELTKYEAMCHMNFRWFRNGIIKCVNVN